jgi:hypothetical protein
MAIPQIQLPVAHEDIPKEVKRLRGCIEVMRAEIKATAALLEAVQAMCPHTKTTSWSDYGGGSNTECKHCGKSW